MGPFGFGFMGPFYITRSVGPVAYELELPQTWKIHPIFHTNLLPDFRTSAWRWSEESALDELEINHDRSYEVEKLLWWRYVGTSGKRTRRKKREFLVVWRDYSIDDASWTYEDNLTTLRIL